MHTSTCLGQFGGGGCDANVNLMPRDSLSTQISELHTNYYLYLRLIKSTKTVSRCCSRHLWLRTGEYSIKMTVGTLYIDLQHEITPLPILISHSPPVWWHYNSKHMKSPSNPLNCRSSSPDCWCEAYGIAPVPRFSTTPDVIRTLIWCLDQLKSVKLSVFIWYQPPYTCYCQTLKKLVAACQHLNQAANVPLSPHPPPTKPLASSWTKINTVCLPRGLYTTTISSFPVVDVVDEKRTPLLDESVEAVNHARSMWSIMSMVEVG